MSADRAGQPWCWADDAGDIVVKAQPAVAVYPGPSGVVIRRRADWPDEDDDVIWFDVGQALAIAKAILEAAGLDAADVAERAPESAQMATKPMASTAAERQKRYRQRKKTEPAPEPDIFEPGTVTGDVTPRDDRNGSGDGEAA